MSLDSQTRLKFKQKLSANALRGISAAELIKRLKALHVELAAYAQDAVVVSSLDEVRSELITPTLLHHKDKGVRIYVAACLVDLLRLYAPDAPYTGPELRDIFDFILRQLQGLIPQKYDAKTKKDTETAYFQQYVYILESLATVKSVVLICDLPGADELIFEAFRVLMEIVGGSVKRKVEVFVISIMVELIQESAALPSDVAKLLLDAFLPAAQTASPTTFSVVVQVCQEAANRLQRSVYQHYFEILGSAASDISKFDDSEYAKTFAEAHAQIIEIWKAAPMVLSNVIPQIDQELVMESETIRLTAVETLATIIASSGSLSGQANNVLTAAALGQNMLKAAYPAVWKTWLGRQVDKSIKVRILLTERLLPILATSPDLASEAQAALSAKMLDPDDKVRLAACTALTKVSFEDASRYLSKSSLQALGERCKDKRASVREAALSGLARLYDLAFDEIAAENATVVEKFGWIPENLMQHVYVEDNTLKALIDMCWSKHIMPSNLADADRVRRALTVVQSLGERGRKAFFSRLRNQVMVRQKIAQLGSIRETSSSGRDAHEILLSRNPIDLDSTKLIRALSVHFANHATAEMDLAHILADGDNRFFKAISICSGISSSTEDLVAASAQARQRAEHIYKDQKETVEQLIQLATTHLFDSRTLPHFVSALSCNDTRYDCSPRLLLDFVSEAIPSLYVNLETELTTALSDKSLSEKTADFASIIRAFTSLVKVKPDVLQKAHLRLKMMSLARGRETAFVRPAVGALCVCERGPELSKELVTVLAKSLSKVDEIALYNALIALHEVIVQNPDSFEVEAETIISHLLERIVILRQNKGNWPSDSVEMMAKSPSTIRLALLHAAIDLLVSRAEVFAARDDSAVRVATPVMALLMKMLANRGSFSATEGPKDDGCQAKVRLWLGEWLLRLSRVPAYDRLLSPAAFNKLVLLVQDDDWRVREGFLSALMKALADRRLASRFNNLLFVFAHDPDASIRNMAAHFVQKNYQSVSAPSRLSTYELTLPRLLHLIAHHPDCTSSDQDLLASSRYLRLYLECIANAENVTLLFHLAQKCKTVKDAIEPDRSNHIYLLSEIIQFMISKLKNQHSWTISTFPGHVKLPGDIFQPFDTKADTEANLRHQYLKASLVSLLEEAGLVTFNAKASLVERDAKLSRRPPVAAAAAAALKRSSPSKDKKKNKRRKPLHAASRNQPHRVSRKSSAYAEASNSEDEDDEVDAVSSDSTSEADTADDQASATKPSDARSADLGKPRNTASSAALRASNKENVDHGTDTREIKVPGRRKRVASGL